MDIISCKNVVKRFNQFVALDNISLAIPKGSIFGLLGPNGAGKTTLIRILTQITAPDSGEIFFNGTPLKESDISSMGYLPEERGLYKKMKVGEQALYLARLKGMSSAEAARELKSWFKKFEIFDWWDKKVEELSKGMAQKVQFITTILHKPSLLILDEPFSGFDPVNVQLVRGEILEMKKRGTTIILSTHNMESVEELCDNIALINRAKLIKAGALEEIRSSYGKSEVELLYRAPTPSALNGLKEGRVVSNEQSGRGEKAVIELLAHSTSQQLLTELIERVEILSYREIIPRMNDIFINLVSQ